MIEELAAYLGANFESGKLAWSMVHAAALTEGWEDFQSFQQQEKESLYVLAQLERQAWWWPHDTFLREQLVGGEGSILFCPAGIGFSGLDLAARGWDVSFADTESRATDFLRWRIERRGLSCLVYTDGLDDVPYHDLAVGFWAAQRYPPDEQRRYIQQLASGAGRVILDLDARWASLDPFYAVDGPGLVEWIRQEYDVVRHKTVNAIVQLVCFDTGTTGAESADESENDSEV